MITTNPQTCAHRTVEVRKKRDSAGREIFRKQCLGCGSGVGSFVKRAQVFRPEIAPEWDVELEQKAWDEWRKVDQGMREERRQKEKDEFDEWYQGHLGSDAWQAKRRAVFKRDGGICRACGIRPATEVHHLTYKHVGDEPLFELVAICGPCHRKLTEMDRARQQSAAPGLTPGFGL